MSVKPGVAEYFARDTFLASLGVRLEHLEEGRARYSVVVTEEMLNFHGMTHGGLLFSLADAALAAASNSRGQTSVATQLSINFVKATVAGVTLVAEARELHAGGPLALYEVEVREAGTNELVARAQATTYRKKESFIG
jgi:acyl-CoA thioesterase